ncbi:MAG: tRNA 2-thiouridine(34) synthase MnmA, partial [Nanoarchaeota archaeon]|nr:tRNA 2-thiouridine(34) synthase MnmA [Nanoarchaeota archaeon]
TRKELLLKNYNFISGKKPTTSMNVKAKIRYGQEPKEAIIHPAKNNILKVKFKEPQFAVTPGQICVFYKEEKCLGGGIIE